MIRTKCSSSRRISRNSIRSVHSRFCFKPSLFQILLFVQRIPFGFPRDFRQEVRPSPPHAAFSLSERSNQSVHRLLPPFQILSFHINHRTEFHINHRAEFHSELLSVIRPGFLPWVHIARNSLLAESRVSSELAGLHSIHQHRSAVRFLPPHRLRALRHLPVARFLARSVLERRISQRHRLAFAELGGDASEPTGRDGVERGVGDRFGVFAGVNQAGDLAALRVDRVGMEGDDREARSARSRLAASLVRLALPEPVPRTHLELLPVDADANAGGGGAGESLFARGMRRAAQCDDRLADLHGVFGFNGARLCVLVSLWLAIHCREELKQIVEQQTQDLFRFLLQCLEKMTVDGPNAHLVVAFASFVLSSAYSSLTKQYSIQTTSYPSELEVRTQSARRSAAVLLFASHAVGYERTRHPIHAHTIDPVDSLVDARPSYRLLFFF